MTAPGGWPRLCLDLSHHAWTRDTSPDAPFRTLAHAEAADRAGIDVIWVNEDLDGWDAFALLGAIAGRTSGAQLGTAVTTPSARHPNTLASSVATLDRLSEGRMVLGIGRGQSEWLDHGLGLASTDGVAAISETIRLLRQWWAPNHRASLADGEVFPVRAWERSLHPARPSIPILVAAAGPRALAMTADLADGVMLNAMSSNHAVRQIVSSLRERRAELGRPEAIDWVVLKTAITVTASDEETDRVLRRQRRVMAMINALPGMTSLIESPRWNIDEIMTTVRQRLKVDEHLKAGGGFPALRREDLDHAAAAIPLDLVAEVSITGSIDYVHQRICECRELGVTHLSVAPPREASISAWQATLERLRQP